MLRLLALGLTLHEASSDYARGVERMLVCDTDIFLRFVNTVR